jgi:hypothetical protein
LSLPAAPEILSCYPVIDAQKIDGLPVQGPHPYYLVFDYVLVVNFFEQVPILQISARNNSFNNESTMGPDVHGAELYIPKEGRVQFKNLIVVLYRHMSIHFFPDKHIFEFRDHPAERNGDWTSGKRFQGIG